MKINTYDKDKVNEALDNNKCVVIWGPRGSGKTSCTRVHNEGHTMTIMPKHLLSSFNSFMVCDTLTIEVSERHLIPCTEIIQFLDGTELLVEALGKSPEIVPFSPRILVEYTPIPPLYIREDEKNFYVCKAVNLYGSK